MARKPMTARNHKQKPTNRNSLRSQFRMGQLMAEIVTHGMDLEILTDKLELSTGDVDSKTNG